MNNEIRFRVALDGAQQVQAGAQQAAQGVERLGTTFNAAQRQAGLTGQQTAQLSNQLQDLFIQIQAGGNPLTAFLQQGSQLSAVFGGAGNALRAVAGLVTPAVAAFAGVAAALGTVAYAFLQGDKERMAFAKGIAMTGNAAGVTASQLNELAKAAASYGASRGQGADVLAQLVATGQVAGSVLGKATEAAIRLERDGGVAIDKTVQAFAEIGKSPVEAIKRLNEGQNFLSAGTYKQIRALQEQGKELQAAALAQETYATASVSRMKELENQLGAVEKAWRFVGREAAEAWQKILNIGRPDMLQDQFKAAQAALDALEAGGGPRQYRPGLDRPEFGAALEKRKQDQRQVVESLRAQVLAEIEVAQATADGAAARDKSIKAIDQQADAAKKAAEEFRHLADAGRNMVEGWNLSDAGFDPSFIQQMKELQAYAKAAGLSTEQLAVATERLLQKQPFAQRELKAVQDLARARADARNAEDKGIDEYLDKQQKARDASLQSAQDSILKLQEESAAAELMRGTNLSLAEAIELVGIARLREQQGRLTEGSEPYIALEREIEARRQLIGLLGEKATREASAKAAADSAQEWERTASDIRGALTDAFRRAFESGDDFGSAFAKTLGNEIKARVAAALAEALAGQVLALAFGANGGAGGGSGYGNTLQGINAAGTLYQAYNGQGIVGGAAGYLASTNYAYGAAIGTTNVGAGSQAAMLAAQTGEFGTAGTVATSQAAAGAGSGAASWASVAGWVAFAILGAMKASSDYSEGFNSSGSRQVSKDTGVYAFGGYEADRSNFFKKLGVGDRWADILSGSTAVAKIFGRAAPRVDATGVSGWLGNGDFAGQAYADVVEKGGIFRSDKRYTEMSALPEELGRFMDDASAAVFNKAKDFGAALGLPAQALSNVTTEIKVALTDDADANFKAIAEALGTYGDALVAGYADAVKPLANYGETTAQTISRVGESISGVNDVLDALGLTALQASIDGGKAAIALQSAFGGLSTLQQAASGYLQNYYSDSERSALTRRAIGQTLGAAGLEVPATREAFRSLVDAQDLMTESGRNAFAVLMSVQDAFASLADVGRSVTDILNERNDIEERRLTLLGDTAALRELQLAKLDASNRPLQQTVYGLEDAAALRSAIDSNIAKFLTPQQAADYQYSTIARDLQSAGLFGGDANLAGTLKGASKDQIFAFASQFVALASNSTDAKIAIVEAAGALASLKETAAAAAEEFAKRITQFTSQLRSSDLSPLSFREQLNNARGLYERTLTRAQAGDTSAQQDLLGNAQAYLQELRSFFGSSADYAAAFTRVTTDLDKLGAPSVDPQVQAIRDQVVQLEAVRSSVVDLSTTSGNRADTQAELARAQIVELQNVVEAQAGTNAALAAGHRALWDQLEALNVRVQRLLDNAQLDAVSPT